MKLLTLFTHLLYLAGAIATPILQDSNLEARDVNAQTCHADNCLRAILSLQHSHAASLFCKTCSPPHISTLTTTRTLTTSFANNILQPFTTVTNTSTLIIYTTLTSTHPQILSSPPPPTTSTITLVPTPPPWNPSLELIPRSPQAYEPLPTFLAPCSDAEKLSSACSCLSLSAITYATKTVDVTVGIFGGTTTRPTSTVTNEKTVRETLTTTFALFEP